MLHTPTSVFPRAPRAPGAAPIAAHDFLQLVDIRTKIVSISSLLIGTTYAFVSTGRFSATMFLLMLAATLLIDMGTTCFNSYYDFVRGVDTPHTDVERWKAMVQRKIDPAAVLRLSWLLFALAAVVGLAIGAIAGWGVVVAGGVCMIIALLYSAGPAPIASLPVGEVFAGGLLGAVLIVVSAYVQAGGIDAGMAWLGLPSSVLIATILSVNNACDVEGDRAAGRNTLAILLGPSRAETLIRVQLLATLAFAVALVPLHVLARTSWAPLAIVALVAWRELQAMHRHGFSHVTKAQCMGGISKVFLAYTIAILASLAISKWSFDFPI
jgi:1,4-dihydroxy-2-naphthoate octaprenyltransferase